MQASCVYQVNGGEGRSPDPISGKALRNVGNIGGQAVGLVGKRGHINVVASLWWEASARAIGGI